MSTPAAAGGTEIAEAITRRLGQRSGHEIEIEIADADAVDGRICL